MMVCSFSMCDGGLACAAGKLDSPAIAQPAAGAKFTNMIGLLSIIALGFFLGMRHATDPDHVIAVTTIVSRYKKVGHAALIGAVWGLGHTITIFVVGGGIILFGWVIPARIGLSMEFSVGLMLILLGLVNLTGILQWITQTFSPATGMSGSLHSHAHSHGDYIHTHPHQHDPEAHPHAPSRTPLSWLDRHFGRLGVYQLARPLVVGLVHGLAGSAAVALLVLTTIRNPKWAVVYLLVFGVGAVAGMMLITGALVLPFAFADNRFSRLNRGLRIASGLISVAFGLFIVYHIGFVNGLFTSRPQWTPR
jgi:high-affinity nickel-transport protein